MDATPHPLGPPADQDAVRAGRDAQERRDLERGAQGRHARSRAGQVRIRSRSGDRARLPSQRRDELGLSRRSSAAARTRRSCTTQVQPADGAGRFAPRRCRGQLPGLHRRHHAHLPGQWHVQRPRSARSTRSFSRPRRRESRRRRPASDSATSRRRATKCCAPDWCGWGSSTEPKGQQFKIWSTHGVSHWIGMEVHDVAVPRPLGAGDGVRDRAGHLHPRGGARQPAKDARERRLHREGSSDGAEVPEHRRAHRGFVPADRGGARAALERRAADDRRDRTVDGGKK